MVQLDLEHLYQLVLGVRVVLVDQLVQGVQEPLHHLELKLHQGDQVVPGDHVVQVDLQDQLDRFFLVTLPFPASRLCLVFHGDQLDL